MSKPGIFKPGDPRINRKGRPKNFTQLRALAQVVAQEPVLFKDGAPLIINGKSISTIERILRTWATSSNPKMQQQFVEVAYGKTPTEIILQQSLDALPDDALDKLAKGKTP